MDLDLLERCRLRDTAAFRGLVSLWGDQALGVARRAGAPAPEAAVRDAFVAAWRELPSYHSERPFRPWFLGHVARAALAGRDAADELLAALARPEAPERADHAARSLLGSLAPAALGQTFYDDVIEPALPDEAAVEVRRLLPVAPAEVWGVLVEPSSLGAWTGMRDVRVRPNGPLRVDTRVGARGMLAGRRPTRETWIVGRAEEPRLLAWVARVSIGRMPGAIELRSCIELAPTAEGSRLAYRLLGVAFPSGFGATLVRRAYARAAAGMQPAMHRAVERLAALATVGGRRDDSFGR